MESLASELIYSIFITLLYNTLLILSKRISNKKALLIANFIIISTVFIFIHIGVTILFLPFVGLVLFFYFFILNKNLYYSIIMCMLLNLIFILSCNLSINIILDITGNNYLSSYVLVAFYKTFFILSFSFCTAIMLAFKKIFMLVECLLEKNSCENKKLTVIIIYFIVSLLIVYFDIISSTFNKNYLDKIFFISISISIVLFLAINITMLYFNNKWIVKLLYYKTKETEYKQLKEYNEVIELVASNLKKFRHDYLNILSTIKGYLDQENYAGLNEFYNNELFPKSESIFRQEKDLVSLKHIKIDSIKGLISSKILTMYKLKINVDIEILDDINTIDMNLIDITRILGILIDNAIEGCQETLSKHINFAVIKGDNCIIFTISNSYNSGMKQIHNIYNKGFTTKGEGRGLGLKIVRQLLDEDYPNALLNTKLDESYFRQDFIIYNLVN